MKKIIISFTVIFFMLVMSISVRASSTEKLIYLPSNQIWTDRTDNAGQRTGNYSYTEVRCHSVYPESGFDTFSKMQVRLSDMYHNIISNTYVLTEGSSFTKVYLLEGTLSVNDIYYEFRGNSNSSAYAVVTYKDK